MKRKLLAIVLITCFSPIALPENTRAQTGVEAIPCIASGWCVFVGGVILGGIYYYRVKARNGKYYDIDGRNLQNHREPIVQAGPNPNMRTQQEVHGAVNQSDCNKIAARFRRAGRRVTLVDIVPNNIGVGGVLRYKCIFEGEDAQPGWYGN